MNQHLALWRLKGKPKLRKFATIDVETRQWEKVYAVGFYDGKKYVDFFDYTYTDKAIDEALEHVLTPEYAGYWIYAHNGGRFDFEFFIRRLMKWKFRKKYSIDIIPVGSTVISLTVTEFEEYAHDERKCRGKSCQGCKPKRVQNANGEGKNLEWTFVDSVRLVPLSLAEAGRTFQVVEKMKTGFTYDELALPQNHKTVSAYLREDNISLYQIVDKMQKVVNKLGGQLGITLPSTAVDLFRRKFQSKDIHTNRHYPRCKDYGARRKSAKSAEKECIPGCMHEFIRQAYFGGRTEIYRMEFKPYTDERGRFVEHAMLYDINSHYPDCMREPMPVGPAIEMEGLEEEAVWANALYETNRVGIVDCDVEIPDCYLPPLPVRHGGKLIFPTGKLRGTWDTSELKLLQRIGGRIVRTRKSLWFETAPLFVRFVSALYKFRDKSRPDWNEGLDFVAKILMNSLYGKWAMREERTKYVINPSTPEGLMPISFEGNIWAEKTVVSPQYIIPGLSVHITSLARARLWEFDMNVIEQGGRLYYGDTDSLICSGVQLPTGKQLGALKHEATIKRAIFTLPKLYLIETVEDQKKKTLEKNIKVKAKGCGPGLRGDMVNGEWVSDDSDDPFNGQLSEDEFDDLRNGLPIERYRLSALREGLNDEVKKRLSFPSIKPAVKQMRSMYDKRTVEKDYNTKPLKMSMW